MPTFLLVSASALLLAAIVTEIFTRFLPMDYWTLLLTVAAALFVNGLFNARVAQRGANGPAKATSGADSAPAGRGGNRKRDNSRNRNRGGKRNDKNDQGGRQQNRADSRPAKSTAPAVDGPREEGTVKWFNRSKGYGFVIRGNGEEIFVHQRSIVSSGDRQRPVLHDGQKVSFVVSNHEKGAQAEQVQAVD